MKNETNTEKLSENKDIYRAYETNRIITWCGGCGNFGIQNALKQALTIEKISFKDVVFCFDVGCSGNGSDKIDAYTVHGLHGRVIPLASGVKLANPNLKVIAHGGDGATLNEGINHLIHAIRNNVPVVFLHHNNGNFALTTGQASAASRKNIPMNSAPFGAYIDPINPLELILPLKPSFMARTYSGDIRHMVSTFQDALHHDGFAFIDIIQVCSTYNKYTLKENFANKIKYAENRKDYDPYDMDKARELSKFNDDEVYMGILYKNKEAKSYLKMHPVRKNIKTAPFEEVGYQGIQDLLKEFK